MQRTRVKPGFGAFVLAATSAVALGCGGSSDQSPFVGTWMITQATATVTCPGNPAFPATPAGNVEFAPGATTAITAVSPAELDPASFCDFQFDVNGTKATINSSHGTQSCTLVSFSLSGFAAKLSPTTWTFSLTGPNSAEETGEATLQLPTVDTTGAATGTAVCNYSGHMATLTRVARN